MRKLTEGWKVRKAVQDLRRWCQDGWVRERVRAGKTCEMLGKTYMAHRVIKGAGR